jgi:uncharacterized cofD-like protein
MFDDGGSSGKLRKELGVLPVGDIRQCLTTLSKNNAFVDLFHYRFNQGELKGHNLGNLLIVAEAEMAGDLNHGLKKIGKILDIEGKIIPVTLKDSNIKAILKNDEEIIGEENIINCKHLSNVGIKKLFLEPKVKANPKAVSSIKNADVIIIGPGKFYTSLIPILLVKEIKDAIQRSRAKKVFICNLMTQVGNTDHFNVEDFVTVLEKYLGKNVIDYVVFNTGRLSLASMKEVKKVFPKADFIQYNKNLLEKKNFIGADILNHNVRKLNPADTLVQKANQRTTVLHNSDKLAKVILDLI